ncbi:long-chain-fatty-acid--CoA ligase 5-like isoform X1 [Argopecten irradians]|uniref:long-chain-fatty-acid--CoA ligase 5-like isoform X1 n=1 Tax=Argopecten irradians TaxID=31199 RepID=UPI00371233FA
MGDEYTRLMGATAVAIGAVTTASAYYLTRSPPSVPLVCDLENQSSIVPGKDRARISKLCTNGKLITEAEDGVTTLYEAFKRGARLSNNGPCYGWKPSPKEPYRWLSYNDVLVKAANVGAGLLSKGLKASNRTFVGIYSQNRVEYGIMEQGCYMYSMVLVPLYDTLGPEACSFIINQADIELVCCDKNVKVQNVLNRIKETPQLRMIVLIEPPTPENVAKARDCGIELIQFSDLEKLGEQNPVEPSPAKPDDLCVLCYTSGTTGLPKGAMLTHKGTLATVAAANKQLEPAGITITPDDVLISYLPLAHSYERLLECYLTMYGAKIGFFQGDVRMLMDDIKELRPTLFPSVPRLLNRFYDKVVAGTQASAVKQFMFKMAMSSKDSELKRSIIRKDSLWDKLVFKKIQEGLGGRVKLITTGSAPLSAKVLQFLRCCVGCPILEGYGQTESHAICSLTVVGDAEVGHVGIPLACNYLKVADVPDMNYFGKDNKGEVCIKGANVFAGYYKDPEKTKEALDDEGWLHTGDIGEWLPNGTLKIIDRKKHIFKLAQGEYIAPEKIENVYVRSTMVAQMFVHGDSLKSSLVGVVVPDPDTFPQYAKSKLGVSGTLQELAKDPKVKKAILDDITAVGKQSGLHSFEQVKDIHVFPELFSVENGLLTPTFKAKRNELKVYFKSEIEEMYSKLT